MVKCVLKEGRLSMFSIKFKTDGVCVYMSLRAVYSECARGVDSTTRTRKKNKKGALSLRRSGRARIT